MPPPPETLLGFDYGRRRIGVAVGQRITATATALTTLAAHDGKPDWVAITELLEQWHPQALVVGIPLQLDGSASEITEAAQRFARQLHGRYHLPVHPVDERLSSREAESTIKNRRVDARKRSRMNKPEIDGIAAQIILQDWLDLHA